MLLITGGDVDDETWRDAELRPGPRTHLLGSGHAWSRTAPSPLPSTAALLDFGPDNPLSLQGVIHDPTLFAPMLAAIPESIRADCESVLEKELGDFDDVRLSLSWSRESERFGREANQHGDLLQGVFGEIHAESVASAPTDDASAHLDDLARAPDSLSLAPMAADETTRQRFDRAIPAFAENVAQRQQAFVDLSGAARFYDLGVRRATVADAHPHLALTRREAADQRFGLPAVDRRRSGST